LPLGGAYDYRVPDGLTLTDGDFVAIPLGSREATGVVWGQGLGDVAEVKLKDVIGRLDCPPLPEVSGRFVDWVSRYTLSAPGAVLKMAMSVADALTPPKPVKAYALNPQAPNIRLMMSNIQMLVQLESPERPGAAEAVEPTEVVGNIVDRYMPVAAESGKEITWWSEPAEFGIVYSDASTIEHVVANLVDNAVRFATRHVELRITHNPTQFFIRVWDDGPGIPDRYIPTVAGPSRWRNGRSRPASGLGCS